MRSRSTQLRTIAMRSAATPFCTRRSAMRPEMVISLSKPRSNRFSKAMASRFNQARGARWPTAKRGVDLEVLDMQHGSRADEPRRDDRRRRGHQRRLDAQHDVGAKPQHPPKRDRRRSQRERQRRDAAAKSRPCARAAPAGSGRSCAPPRVSELYRPLRYGGSDPPAGIMRHRRHHRDLWPIATK